jgi:hypothetical protein
MFEIANSICVRYHVSSPVLGLSRRRLGLERLVLRFTQQNNGGRSHRLRPLFFIAPARRLSPHSRGTRRPIPPLSLECIGEIRNVSSRNGDTQCFKLLGRNSGGIRGAIYGLGGHAGDHINRCANL